MEEQIVNKKNKKTLLIIGILCFVAIISIVGYTYSYLQITVSNDTSITGTAASVSLSLEVNKLAPDINKPLVPQLDSAIASAVVGTQGNCVDDNENVVCQVYEAVVKNESNVGIIVNGTLELNAGNNSNLKWAIIDSYSDGMTSKPNLVGNIKTYLETEITTNETYNAKEEKTYYIVVWISEQSTVQTDTGHFTGTITFNDSNSSADDNATGYQLLNTMNVGDYVAYVGNHGCKNGENAVTGAGIAESGNSCKGENANQPAGGADSNGTYGYCEISSKSYTTYGWRIAYIDENKVHLISAGSPECFKYIDSEYNVTLINDLNEAALDYCNETYVDGGICPTEVSEDNAVRAVGNEDFEKITYAISGTTSSLTGVYGTQKCVNESVKGLERCGYGNDLIDNGGSYFFAAYDTYGDEENNLSVFWDGWSREISLYNSIFGDFFSGFRPIIRLSSEVYVTGGEGTMTSPYEIGI